MNVSVYNAWNCVRVFFKPRHIPLLLLASTLCLLNSCSRTDQEIASKKPLSHSEIVAHNEKDLRKILEKHCYDCHDEGMKEGDLNLVDMPFKLGDKKNYKQWVRVFERVDTGEMPPKKKKPLPTEIKQDLKKFVAASLTSYDQELTENSGRSVLRRMNIYEYENTLRD